jgi:CheY-like chemotaxis protein
MTDIIRPVVMCVDDNPDWLALVERWLKKNGCTVITASGAAAALKALRGDNPDLVLLDLHMPEMDGYSFCSNAQGMAALLGAG